MEDRLMYRVTSGKCHDALLAYRERRKEAQRAHWAYSESKGAKGLFEGSEENVGNARPINALIFDDVLPDGWVKSSERLQRNLPSNQIAGRPSEKTAAGKAILAEIMALPLLPCADRMILPAIGFPDGLRYSTAQTENSYSSLGFWSVCNVGFIKDVFYLALPDLNKARRELIERGHTVHTPEWQPLDGMEQILKEEAALDFARAKLAEPA